MRPKPLATSLRMAALLVLGVAACPGLACSKPTPRDIAENGERELTLAEQAVGVREGLMSQVRLNQTLVRDGDLDVLEGLESKLLRVNFSRSEISDEGFARLCRLENLEQLRLASPRVSDAGIASLRGLTHLRFLHLIDMPITDAGLDQLHMLTNLESLYLDGTKVTDDGLARLLKALPKIHLHIDDHHHRLDPHGADHTH